MSLLLNVIRSAFVQMVNDYPCKMVLVVRADLPMGRGKTAAQCAHAALECARQAAKSKKNSGMYNRWLMTGQSKIVLKVHSEEELLELAKESKSAKLITSLIQDAGRTQLQMGTYSVLGIGPAPIESVDKITSHLKLL